MAGLQRAPVWGECNGSDHGTATERHGNCPLLSIWEQGGVPPISAQVIQAGSPIQSSGKIFKNKTLKI